MDTDQTITIQVNGQKELIPPEQTLEQFISSRFGGFPNIVAELNGQIIPRNGWNATLLRSRDCLELVHFVGGG